jgi:hypothetical protein
MAARRRPSKSSTPLDDRQRKLTEEQEKLEQRMEKLKSVIAEAPRIAAARARAQRDEILIDRSTRAHHRLNSTTLADTRFDHPASRVRRRPLKAEKRQARLISFALLFLFALLVIWLLNIWHLQWPG